MKTIDTVIAKIMNQYLYTMIFGMKKKPLNVNKIFILDTYREMMKCKSCNLDQSEEVILNRINELTNEK
jgi:hypothetical protein